ncbi:MAG: hypothetical protein A2252_02485 [Elusimicrobia bacterium RIFOXYA2_FULL_39_19]|nr:MAG: hypothetical protein A2252_02485 [Elusimicrobia bacterium RIFOXYA2_FULL_39_19]
MSTTIYYFSGTGNSLAVARELSNSFGSTKVIPISKAITGEIDLSADKIGLVFPVYIWGAPLIVCDFIAKLKQADKYFFSVVTYGGSPGKTNIQIKKLLKLQGIELKAGFAVHMPGNYIPMYGAREKAVQDKLFEKAKTKIAEIAQYVSSGKTGTFEVGGLVMNLLGSTLQSMGSKSMRKADKNYLADEKCNACNICEKICPVKNIKMQDSKPVWQGNCEQCMACIQWCPQEAIQHGKNTAGRARYRHPQVKATDFLN